MRPRNEIPTSAAVLDRVGAASPAVAGLAHALPAEPVASVPIPERVVLGLPLPLWGPILAMSCMLVGWNWDISWHRSIGRDTVWTPAHIAIYLALALAFGYNAALVWSFTGGSRRGQPALEIFGLRAPGGAFLTLWGVLLQFAAVLFDNWWHGVYGLDVAVFSPPHTLLAWGISVFYVGQRLLAVRYRNADPAHDRSTRVAIIILTAIALGHMALAVDPFHGALGMRTLNFVASSPLGFVPSFVLVHRYLGGRWPATACAALYMAATIAMMQVFQLFPATPRLAPVFHPVERFFPPLFPILLVVPALAVDAILRARGERNRWVTSLLVAAAFVVAFNGTNWLAAEFLTSPVAENRFFAGDVPGTAFEAERRTAPHVGLDAASGLALGWAFVASTVLARASLPLADWLRRVRR